MQSLSNSLRFMKTRGFSVARFYECRNKSELLSAFDKLNKPVVLKVDSIKHTHKTEINGVVVGVVDKKLAVKEFERLMLLGESVVIQEQIKGVELIIGVVDDSSFGTLIMFGIGGVFVELLKDVSFRACPITLDDAEEMINELKARKVIDGFRNNPAINRNVIKQLLAKLSRFAVKDKVKELDLNPVIFQKNKYFIVDSRLELF